MSEFVRGLMLVAIAWVVVTCAGPSPRRPAPAAPEPAPTGVPEPTAPATEPPAAQPECTSCFQDGERVLSAGDPVRALGLFERGCQQGEAAACAGAADLHARGEGVPENDLRAVELYVRACELEHWQSCAEIGIPMINSEERAPEGRVLLARGCEGGHAVSCNFLAGAYQQGIGGPVDLAETARLFSRSCELGNALGCSHTGIAFHHGRGVNPDVEKAREYYGRACEGGSSLGCSNLGLALWNGAGGPVDLRGAVVAFERGCARGNATACNGLGVALLRGAGGLEVDAARARAMFEASCNAGKQIACENLAEVEAHAIPTQAEPRWTTNIGSLTIGAGAETATFTDLHSTCSPFPLSLAFGMVAADVRSCLGDSDSRRVRVAVQEGQVASTSVQPDDRMGRCVVSALTSAPLRSLTCVFEATVSR